MEKLRKERTYARSAFTRAKNKLQDAFDRKDSEEIQSCFKIISEMAQKLFGVDERIQEQWLQEETSTEEEIEHDGESAEEYKHEYAKFEIKVQKFLDNEDAVSKYDSASVSGSGISRRRKLPQLELAKFDGKAKNWLGFWSSFKKIHTDQSIDIDDKMAYLIQSMTVDSPAYELVKSFPPCGENYAQAVEQLKSRYARDELLIEIYVRELLSLVLQRKEKNSMTISSLYDKLKTQLRALELLGVTSDKYAAMLYPLVESALPEEMLRVWERQRGKDAGKDTLNNLLEFVRVEVESEERIQIARTSLNIKEETKIPTAACLVAGDSKIPSKSTSNNTTVCLWCDKPSHTSLECYKAQNMTLEARNEVVNKKKACTVCLKPGHHSKRCKSHSKCIICQKKHAVLLCPDINKASGANSTENSELMLANKTNGTTLLQTLTVKIGDETVRAFIDTGAQRSYIKSDIASKLQLIPSGEETLKHSLFGGVETKEESHKVYDLTVKSMTEKVTLNMTALSKEKICGYIPRIRHETSISQKLQQHKLNLTDIGENTPEVGLLIGADHAGKIMTGSLIRLNEDLFAIQTKLGWTLQGTVAPKNDTIIATVDLYSHDINQLWNLETLGIEEPKDKLLRKRTEEEAIESFKENVSVNREGRYEVALPWKIDRPDLLENRFKSMHTQLAYFYVLKLIKELQYNWYWPSRE